MAAERTALTQLSAAIDSGKGDDARRLAHELLSDAELTRIDALGAPGAADVSAAVSASTVNAIVDLRLQIIGLRAQVDVLTEDAARLATGGNVDLF